jgi:hypothetical protein
MNNANTATMDSQTNAPGTLHLRASDGTGSFNVEGDFPTQSTASSVALSIARRMGLPIDAPYTLRTADGQFLLDDKPIGGQLQGRSEADLTVTAKAHLG